MLVFLVKSIRRCESTEKEILEGQGNNFSFLFLTIFKTNRANKYAQNEKGCLSTTLFLIHIVGFQNSPLLSVLYWTSIQPRGKDKYFGEYKGGERGEAPGPSPQGSYLESNQYSRITMIQKRTDKSQKKGIDKLLRYFQLGTTGIGFQYGVEGCKGIEAEVFRQPVFCTAWGKTQDRKSKAFSSAGGKSV